MSKLKKGTFVALDKDFKNICVGDLVRDADGNIYSVDAYGRAVKKADKTRHALSDLGKTELYIPEGAGTAESTSEAEAAPKEDIPAERDAGITLAEASDQQLADELRRRGYRLTARKTVTTKL